ncbi:MAG: hypothetical protein F6J90_40305 [Moorea sp. SIOASIH]|uniref:glycosyltransferase family 39 protein n=1 Tax=Moorena sp. SIOASIH TaxID=2607817 RepID=UPI0013BC3AFB|nr:glycosyltransferase family 39 protein [Moorena sp. SIOASIH]NEO42234.1 hypothetical protein [Moorena sp. SIOASIH]
MNANNHKTAALLEGGNWFRPWMPITLILLLATGLYVYQLGTESLWVDELISINRAKHLERVFSDTRPLYHILLQVWMIVSSSDTWLRGLCVVFSIGTVFVTYQLGRRLIGESTGLIAALIVALSPLFIHHAQEVRMYAPSTFFGVAGTLILTHALERPTTPLLLGWAALRFLAIISTPLNVALLLPDIVVFGWKYRNQPRVLFRFGVGLLLIGILWLPWVFPLVTKSAKFMGGVKVPGTSVPDLGGRTSPGVVDVIMQPGRLTAWPFGRANSNAIYWFYNAYSVMLTCLLGVVLFNKPRSAKLGWIAAWAFLPLVLFFSVSQVSRSLWVNRYLLLAAPYLFILLAAAGIGIWRRWRIGALVIALIYAIAVGGGLKRYYTVLDRENWRGLVETIATKEQPGDVIVWSIGQRIPVALNHYYHGSTTIEIKDVLPRSVRKNDQEAIEGWVNSLPPTQSRLWLVYVKSSKLFRSVVKEQFQIEAQEKPIDGIEIFLLKPRSAEKTSQE